MPFTLSHPAAVLLVKPFLGRLAVPSALAIGAMTPDLPYFVAAPIPRSATHSLGSVLWFSLPLGWLAYLVFERGLRAPLVHLLPATVRCRLSVSVDLAPAAAVASSIVAGAATHVVWDAFTHGSAGLVAAVPPLAAAVRAVAQVPSLGFARLQYGSSLLGLLLLAAYAGVWLRRTPARRSIALEPVSARARSIGRLAVCGVAPLLGLLAGLALSPRVHDWESLGWLGAHVAVAATTAGLSMLAVAAPFLRAGSPASRPLLAPSQGGAERSASAYSKTIRRSPRS